MNTWHVKPLMTPSENLVRGEIALRLTIFPALHHPGGPADQPAALDASSRVPSCRICASLNRPCVGNVVS